MNSDKLPYATGDLVVYPSHGVGKIVGIETQEIAGHTLSVFVVLFDKDRMTLRVPLAKAKGSGLRRLSSHKEMDPIASGRSTKRPWTGSCANLPPLSGSTRQPLRNGSNNC